MSCHSERSEDELLRARPKNLNAQSGCIQILRFAQDDTIDNDKSFLYFINFSTTAATPSSSLESVI